MRSIITSNYTNNKYTKVVLFVDERVRIMLSRGGRTTKLRFRVRRLAGELW